MLPSPYACLVCLPLDIDLPGLRALCWALQAWNLVGSLLMTTSHPGRPAASVWVGGCFGKAGSGAFHLCVPNPGRATGWLGRHCLLGLRPEAGPGLELHRLLPVGCGECQGSGPDSLEHFSGSASWSSGTDCTWNAQVVLPTQCSVPSPS